MRRLKATVQYDGTHFNGYQIQDEGRTVQQQIDRALRKIHKDDSIISVASGRTDTGVHALGQVIHFDTPLTIPEERWCIAMNTLLPSDVRIIAVEEVASDFHARYDATGKTYLYKWERTPIQSPFHRNYAVHIGYHYPDVDKMRQAAKHFVGTHDFTSFCSTKTATTNRVRTIQKLSIEEFGDELHMTIEGDGFLYNMVRTIAGMLLAVGRGQYDPDSIVEILAAKNRKKAAKTAPSHGLYLVEVHYTE